MVDSSALHTETAYSAIGKEFLKTVLRADEIKEHPSRSSERRGPPG